MYVRYMGMGAKTILTTYRHMTSEQEHCYSGWMSYEVLTVTFLMHMQGAMLQRDLQHDLSPPLSGVVVPGRSQYHVITLTKNRDHDSCTP